MAEKRLRVILLTHGGADEVLTHLCALDCVSVVGVFVEKPRVAHNSFLEKIKRSIRYDGYLATFRKLLQTITNSRGRTAQLESNAGSIVAIKQIADAHQIPYFTLDNYHSPDSIKLLSSVDADLGIGFGTNILKESVFGLPKLGTINFHNGLVPFYRGGPPVFWELFNDEAEVGLTVHWMAQQVDAGDVILQERVPLSYDYSFGLDFERFILDYRSRLSTKYAELVTKAVASIANGQAPRIAQDPTQGTRYRLPTKSQKDELRRRLRTRQRMLKKTPIVVRTSE